jgi:inward rectifier potassium channel
MQMTTFIKETRNIKNSPERELGFGQNPNTQGQRLMNSNGTSNVVRKGISRLNPINVYHALITMSWTKFNLLVLVSYFLLNCIFACIYFLIGIDQIAGMTRGDGNHEFWEAFFFSAQSFTTVGYGRVSPVGYGAEVLSSFESLMGLLALALATGLLYGRFSRPTARILYSSKALVAPYKSISGLMFRIANARNNQLIEAEAQFIFSINTDVNGEIKRTFHNLKLEIEKINLLSLSWTIVHPISDESPLKGLTKADLEQGDAEFIVMLKAIDDTYAQTIYDRSSYKYHQVEWNARFNPILGKASDGRAMVDLSRISDFQYTV